MREDTTMMRRCFKYRCYPNVGTKRRLWNVMRRVVTPVWNACISEREATREQYRAALDEAFCDAVIESRRDLTEKEEKAIRQRIGKEIHWPTAYDQYKHARKGDHPEYEPYSSSMLECVIAKVDGSEKSFRALWLKGHTDARPPAQTHLHSCLTFRKSGWKLDGDRLTLTAVGTIKIRMHRPIVGKVKTVSVTRTRTNKWFVCFSCEIDNLQGPCGAVPGAGPAMDGDCGKSTLLSDGSDPQRGGTHNCRFTAPVLKRDGSDPEKTDRIEIFFPSDLLIYDSEGREIPHPAFYASEVAVLARLNQSLARKHIAKPGDRGDGSFKGRNRRKAKRLIAKWHERIANKRADFLWHIARFYAQHYKRVVVNVRPIKEKIQYAVTSEEALRLCDGAYGKFTTMLKQKCEEFGTQWVEQKGEWFDIDKQHAQRVRKYEENKAFVREAQKAVKRNDRKAAKRIVDKKKRKSA